MDPDKPDEPVPGERLGAEDLGAVSVAFETPLDLARTAAAVRLMLVRPKVHERRLRVLLGVDMITLIGASSVDAADDRLTLARTIAENDNTRAIIRREPSDSFDRPVIGRLRLAVLDANYRSEHWQSPHVLSHWESRVVTIDVTAEEMPLWSAPDAEIVKALRIPAKRLLLERSSMRPMGDGGRGW